MSIQRDWTPVRHGDNYCSPACGGGCTYEAYQKAVTDAEKLAQLCIETIGGVWKPVVHENLGWHWYVAQEDTNIAIYKGGYLAHDDYYTVGFGGGTPAQVSVHPQTFPTPKDAYMAQATAIKAEADKWNKIMEKINPHIIPTHTANIESSSTHSPAGSAHWFQTLTARILHIGEFLKKKTPESVKIDADTLRTWGEHLYDAAQELIKHRELINSPAKLEGSATHVYIVMTPEGGYIGMRTTKEQADTLLKETQDNLEFSGSHQSAYIVEDTIIL